MRNAYHRTPLGLPAAESQGRGECYALNLPPYINPGVDRLIEQAELTFDPRERDRFLAQVNEIIVDDAPWIFIVHDLNPRALSPKVKGFIQAQSWYQDFTLPWVEN